MAIKESMVRFLERRGHLKAIEIKRSDRRPVIAAAHAALLAVGVTVTSYQASPTSDGLGERLELSSLTGEDLDEALSEKARSAILPVVLMADPQGS